MELFLQDRVHRTERLRVLSTYDILDTEPEPAFDRLTTLAAALFDVPTALVSFVDANRQWHKSCVGFERKELSLDRSFCVHALGRSAPLIVPDAARDERFESNPLVTDDGIRFYAGAPITAPNGSLLGTVCVLDTEPHDPSSQRIDGLEELAAMAVDALIDRRHREDEMHAHASACESRASSRTPSPWRSPLPSAVNRPQSVLLAPAETRYAKRTHRIEDQFDAIFDDPNVLVGILNADGTLRAANDTAMRYIDETRSDVYGEPFWTTPWWRSSATVRDQLRADIERAATGEYVDYQYEQVDAAGNTFIVRGSLRPVTDASGAVTSIIISGYDVTRREAQRRDLAMLRSAIEEAADGVAVLEDGKYVYVDQTHADMYGFDDADALMGESWRQLYDADEVQRLEENAFPVLESEGHWQGRVTGARPDASRFPAEISLTATRDDRLVCTVRDRTEQDARQQKLNLVLRETDTGIAEWNVEEGTVTWDETLQRLFGHSPATYDEFESLVHPHDRSRVRAALKRVLDDAPSWNGEFRIRDDQGNVRWMRTRVVPVEVSGQDHYLLATGTDVTEKKRKEEQLRTLNERFQQFAATVPHGLFSITADYSEVLYLNDAVADLYGVDTSDLQADPESWTRHVHPQDLPAVLEDVARQKNGTMDGPHRQTFRIQHPTRGVRWINTTVHPICDTDGTVQRLAGVATDVTEQKNAEQKLRRNRERWQRLIEKQRDAVVITVDGEIRYVNPAGVELLAARSAETLVGQPVADILPMQEMQLHLEGTPSGRSTEADTYNIQRFDDEERIVEAYAVPIPYEDQQAAQMILRDVTERVRTRRQLQHAQKMETIGTLAGGIAHDFNNILHAATTYLQMAEEDLTGEAPSLDDVSQYVQRSVAGLERGRELVDQLLRFSRRESGDETAAFETVDLAEVAEETLALSGPSLPKHVGVETDLEPGVVEGDPGQLQQVLMNLITNAGHAMDPDKGGEGGSEATLRVEVEPTAVDAQMASSIEGLSDGPHVMCTISDTGCGMDATTQERLFEPFYTTKETGEGTGLGLSVVYGIVEAHAGTIRVTSTPGVGTTFRILLPAAEAAVSDAGARREQDQPLADCHVLVVDDDADVRQMETVRLEGLGASVTTAEAASEALSVLRGEAAATADGAVDVVLTDYAMPQMTGIGMVLEMRMAEIETPVVMMSGFAGQIPDEKAEAAGVHTLLRKPTTTDAIATALTDALHAAA